MPTINILLLERDSAELERISLFLAQQGYTITTAQTLKRAKELLESTKFDIVLTAQNLKQGRGTDLIQHLILEGKTAKVLVMTSEPNVEETVQLMKMGAFHVWAKPVPEPHLLKVLKELAIDIRLHRQIQVPKPSVSNQPVAIAVSRKFRKIIEFAQQVAVSKSTVLLTGETGTGKEIVASVIHASSPRADKPFVKINCGAIPETLLEAELFGYERGAFSGAVTQKKGRIEHADGGTLFLDEIGDLSPALQVKLLHVLQHSEFDRLGGVAPIKVDVRFIAATNLNLEEKILEKQFREDLFYRLSVINLHIPALREHREDIPFLAQFFIQKYNARNNKNAESLEPYVIKKMLSHPWKGNVRELENMIERAVTLSNETVLRRHLFPTLQQTDFDGEKEIILETGKTLEEMEKLIIEKTLSYFHYDKQKTARVLNIGSATLYRKLKKYTLM